MEAQAGNLLDDLPAAGGEEEFRTLLSRPGLKIERIVSTGQASPSGFWYDQAWDEWVLLVSGAAEIAYDDSSAPSVLAPGAWLHIPPGRRHRVAWTHPDEPTIWLAIHSGDIGADGALA